VGERQKRGRREAHYPGFMWHVQDMIYYLCRFIPESSCQESARAAVARVVTAQHDKTIARKLKLSCC